MDNFRGLLAWWRQEQKGAAVSLQSFKPLITTPAWLGLAGKSPQLSTAELDGVCVIADARIDRVRQFSEAEYGHRKNAAQLILAAYLRWGNECVSHLSGDFAFVVWNGKEGHFWAARDPMGTKVLHWFNHGSHVAFASDAGLLAQLLGQGAELSPEGLWMWLQGRYDERFTLYKRIHQLPAGSWLQCSPHSSKLVRYWDFGSVPVQPGRKHEDLAHHFRTLFERAVLVRSGSKGTIGTTLSGGLDSSAVTAVAALQSSPARPVMPFSFRFRTLSDCMEAKYSDALAERHGLNIEKVDAESYWLFREANQGHGPLGDSPFQCWDLMDHHIFTRLQGAGGTILLTGHGGDNLVTGLGPLPIWAAQIRRGRLGLLPRFLRRIREKDQQPLRGLGGYLIKPSLPSFLLGAFSRWSAGRHAPAWVAKQQRSAYGAMASILNAPPKIFSDLARQKLYAMMIRAAGPVRRVIHWYEHLQSAYTIAVGHPCYDFDLACFVLGLPPEETRLAGLPKGLLRQALGDALPTSITQRTDKPDLASFYHFGMLKEAEAIRGLLRNSRLADLGLIELGRVQTAFEDYLAKGAASVQPDFWGVLVLEWWLAKRA